MPEIYAIMLGVAIAGAEFGYIAYRLLVPRTEEQPLPRADALAIRPERPALQHTLLPALTAPGGRHRAREES